MEFLWTSSVDIALTGWRNRHRGNMCMISLIFIRSASLLLMHNLQWRSTCTTRMNAVMSPSDAFCPDGMGAWTWWVDPQGPSMKHVWPMKIDNLSSPLAWYSTATLHYPHPCVLLSAYERTVQTKRQSSGTIKWGIGTHESFCSSNAIDSCFVHARSNSEIAGCVNGDLSPRAMTVPNTNPDTGGFVCVFFHWQKVVFVRWFFCFCFSPVQAHWLSVVQVSLTRGQNSHVTVVTSTNLTLTKGQMRVRPFLEIVIEAQHSNIVYTSI